MYNAKDILQDLKWVPRHKQGKSIGHEALNLALNAIMPSKKLKITLKKDVQSTWWPGQFGKNKLFCFSEPYAFHLSWETEIAIYIWQYSTKVVVSENILQIHIIKYSMTFLQNPVCERFVSTEQKKSQGTRRDNEVLLQKQKAGGLTVPYKVIDNPLKLSPEDW